jgi:predicted nucleic acid-binding protein
MQWDDLEDAIQYASAQFNGCHRIITRNARDYSVQDSDVQVWSPADFLKDCEG